MEPIDPPIPVPEGGWPQALFRIELIFGITITKAVYEVACCARFYRRGVVATFEGHVLCAWPHQTTSEIARAFERLKAAGAEIENSNSTAIPSTDIRWTATRKAWICTGVDQGTITRAEVCRRFDISEEELDEWLVRWKRFGHAGLQPGKLQILGRS